MSGCSSSGRSPASRAALQSLLTASDCLLGIASSPSSLRRFVRGNRCRDQGVPPRWRRYSVMKTAHQPERNRALSTLIGEGLGPGRLVGVAIPLAWRLGMKGLVRGSEAWTGGPDCAVDVGPQLPLIATRSRAAYPASDVRSRPPLLQTQPRRGRTVRAPPQCGCPCTAKLRKAKASI